MLKGRSIELIGDSGSGKTTQAGEYAKWIFKTTHRKTVLHTADRGGYDSLKPLVDLGVVIPDELGADDDPWDWTDRAVNGRGCPDNVGLHIFDSGSSISDVLMDAAAYADFQIGQQRTQKFNVNRKKDQSSPLTVALNNEAHYGLVQQFVLKKIRESTWLAKEADVLWTFVLFRGEGQDGTPILGPKIAGKALTSFLPKEFRLTFRLAQIVQPDSKPVHRLYLSAHPELGGVGYSFGNARTPLGSDIELPPFIEPANLPEAVELIQRIQEDATNALRLELVL